MSIIQVTFLHKHKENESKRLITHTCQSPETLQSSCPFKTNFLIQKSSQRWSYKSTNNEKKKEDYSAKKKLLLIGCMTASIHYIETINTNEKSQFLDRALGVRK